MLIIATVSIMIPRLILRLKFIIIVYKKPMYVSIRVLQKPNKKKKK